MRNLFLLPVMFVLVLSCEKDSASKAPSTGTGGSLARFTIVDDYLYIADNYAIKTFSIDDPAKPELLDEEMIGREVETIFPYQDKLFIGSREGMFIYSIKDKRRPSLLGQALHLRSCDPVVADNNYSYVTLRSGSPCGPATSGLYLYDITDVKVPVQKSLLQLSSPWGLGLKDSVVFVCQDSKLTLVNVKDPVKPTIMYERYDAQYRDVIPYGDLLICYVTSGLLLYDISNLNNIRKLSHMQYVN